MNFAANLSPAEFTGITRVPLFDPPYKLWDNGPASRTINKDASYLVYTENKIGPSYRQAVLTPTKLTTFQVNPFNNLTGQAVSIHEGASMVSINALSGQAFSQFMQNILLPGGPSIAYNNYPFSNIWFPGNINTGWGRQFSGPIFRTWLNNQLYFANIVMVFNNIWLSPFFTPLKTPLVGNAPSGSTSQLCTGSFQLSATKPYNHTLTMWQNANGSAYVMAVTYDSVGNFQRFDCNQILTDNATINSGVLGNGNFNWSFSEYGILFWWNGAPVFFPGQFYQAMLVAFDPTSLNPRSTYTLLQFNPQTATAAAAVTSPGFGGGPMKIDANGIFYLDPGPNFGQGGFNGSYIANSFGLDINIPGIGTPLQPLNNGIPLQTFCPCSPVAIGQR